MMNFIEALLKIKTTPGFSLCEDQEELSGIRASICVYYEGEFVGKLRWPKDGQPASVDEELIRVLNEHI